MARETIRARTLVTEAGVIDFPVVALEDGRVVEIAANGEAGDEASTLAAAFVDIHTHGAMGHDVMSATPRELAEMQRFLAAHGVGHYLPTTVTAEVECTLRSLERLAEAIEGETAPGEAKPVGVHLEGPFLSHAKRGVHPAAELQEPSLQLFERFWEAARGRIAVMTIAPELPGADELIAYAAAKGVVVSLGHSDAKAADAVRGIDAGARSATHTFNAMRAMEPREPGVLGTVLDDERVFAELICDGVHVTPAMVRLWWKAKGPKLAVLVTDAMQAAGMPDGEYTLGGLPVRVANGRALLAEDLPTGKETLAGSLLTMDRAVAKVREFTQASVADAARMAAANPARLLGLAGLAKIEIGAAANIVRLDAEGRLLEAWVGGVRVERS
jgi:N-acetylglucosamine-6-phosphate deacetylase